MSQPAPGWYRDPSDASQRRWWDGTAWTAEVAPVATDGGDRTATTADLEPTARDGPAPVGATLAPAGRGGRRWLAVVLAVVALLTVAGVAFVVLTAPDEAPELAAPVQPASVAGTDAAGEGDADPGPAEEAPADDTTTTDEGPADDEGPAVEDDDLAADDARFEVIDLDGQCETEIDLTADDPALARAWDHGCAYAPVTLDAGEVRWIAVVASLNGDDHAASDAEDRATREGLHGNVLWSSHYPSLNPNLWVIYDGPFATEAEASNAASWLPEGSYARDLADDPSRRYCLAADGCIGERS